MNAATHLYMAGLGHFVMVSKGQRLHDCIILVVHDRSDHLVMVSNGQLLNEGSISVVHRWSGLSCNGKQWTTVT